MMLSATCGSGSELIELPDTQRQAVAELAGKVSLPAIVQAVAIIQKLAYTVRGSSVARGLVEASIVRLAEADKFVDPASLIDRLQALTGPAGAGRAVASPQSGRAGPAPANRRAVQPQPTRPAQAAQPVNNNLSTAEKQQIHNDPKVREVADLFGGEVVDIRLRSDQPTPPQSDDPGQ